MISARYLIRHGLGETKVELGDCCPGLRYAPPGLRVVRKIAWKTVVGGPEANYGQHIFPWNLVNETLTR